jgi:hypothetical protein
MPRKIIIIPTNNSKKEETVSDIVTLNNKTIRPTIKMVSVWPIPHETPANDDCFKFIPHETHDYYDSFKFRLSFANVETATIWSGSKACLIPTTNPKARIENNI